MKKVTRILGDSFNSSLIFLRISDSQNDLVNIKCCFCKVCMRLIISSSGLINFRIFNFCSEFNPGHQLLMMASQPDIKVFNCSRMRINFCKHVFLCKFFRLTVKALWLLKNNLWHLEWLFWVIYLISLWNKVCCSNKTDR